MSNRAKDGRCLAVLVEMAVPICQRTEREFPRTGPGRRPTIPDWVIAVLIMVAIAKRRKSKSAQFRFLFEHRQELMRWMGVEHFPSRSTYFDRYRRAHRILQHVLQLHTKVQSQRGQIDVACLAVDKSLFHSQGAIWSKHQRDKGYIPPGVDTDSTWTYSPHHGWLQGYGYEAIVTTDKQAAVWPVAASVDPAHMREHRTFPQKIEPLPKRTRYILADAGYDSDAIEVAVENSSPEKRKKRRFVCPLQERHNAGTVKQPYRETKKRQKRRARRNKRREYMKTAVAKKLYARRQTTIEPFNAWFKSLFELNKQAWHKGLDNNRTQVLAALFVYQLLLRYNRRRKRPNGQVRWILDIL